MASNFTSPVYIDGVLTMPGLKFVNPWSKVWFVDAGSTGNTVHDGTTPDTSFATIQAACTAATAHDVIYIRPRTYTLGTGFTRYTEDVTIALGGAGGSAAIATRANLSLIGVTQRGLAATDFLGVRWKHTTATPLTVNAPCVHIENIGFFVEGATYAIYLSNDGASYTTQGSTGFTMYNCAIKGEGKVHSVGCNELSIVNCRFQTKYDGTVGGINIVGSAQQGFRPIIKNCEFIGGNSYNMSAACITTAAPIWDLMIRDCYFSILPDGGLYINIAGTSNTGLVANCYFGAADINAACTGLVAGVSGAFAAGLYDEVGIEPFDA